MSLKSIQYSLILFLLYSCTNKKEKIDLDGSWVITKMYTRGNEIYPKDQTPQKFTFNIAGYENYEKVEFRLEDSTVILPGFSSEELCMTFRYVNSDSIKLYFDTEKFDEYKTRRINYIYQDTVLLKLSSDTNRLNSFIDSLDYKKNQIIESRGSLSKQYDFAKSIYSGKYEILSDSNRGLLLLSSDKTNIVMVSEQFLSKKQTDNMFRGL